MALKFSWLNPKLELHEGSVGGVFARQNIETIEMLAVFGGYIMKVEEEPVFGDHGDFALQITEQLVIGTKDEHEIEDADFFNHSCEPNAGFKGQIFLIAMRDIEAGEEVSFDYAMVLHESESALPYAFDCLCSCPNCRGIVTDNDWKLPELQKRYDGYFQWYLQDKIDRLKS